MLVRSCSCWLHWHSLFRFLGRRGESLRPGAPRPSAISLPMRRATKVGSHDERRHDRCSSDDAARQRWQPGLPLPLPVFAFTPRTDRTILINALTSPPRGQDADHDGRAGLADQRKNRLRSHGSGAFPAAASRQLERTARGRRARPASAANSPMTMAGAITSCRKGMRSPRRTRACSTSTSRRSTDPLGCRLNPASGTYVHFYDNDPGKPFTQWAQYMIDAANLARTGIKAAYGGGPPRYTYAVGTSNGGYQVRRAVELAPKLFDGGVDWEGTYVDEHAPNVLRTFRPAVLNFPDYVTSGYRRRAARRPRTSAAQDIPRTSSTRELP